MIRQATIDDLPKLCEMAFKFIGTTEYAKIYTAERMVNFVESYIVDKDKLALYEEDKGTLLAIKHPFLFGEVLIATEMGWWVEPEYRLSKLGNQLFDAFEQWAKDQGCVRIHATGLDPWLIKYYEKRGYQMFALEFKKDI